MHHWCMYNFSNDQELNYMWQGFACQAPVRRFNTISEMGTWVRSEIDSIFDSNCDVVQAHVNLRSVRNYYIQKKVIDKLKY